MTPCVRQLCSRDIAFIILFMQTWLYPPTDWNVEKYENLKCGSFSKGARHSVAQCTRVIGLNEIVTMMMMMMMTIMIGILKMMIQKGSPQCRQPTEHTRGQ